MRQILPLYVHALCNEGIYPSFNSSLEISYLKTRFFLRCELYRRIYPQNLTDVKPLFGR